MDRLTTVTSNAHSIGRRVGMFSTLFVLLGLSLAVGGLAHDSAVLRNAGIGIFVLALLPLLVILLMAWLSERRS